MSLDLINKKTPGVFCKDGSKKLNQFLDLMRKYNKNTAKFLCGGCTAKGHNLEQNAWSEDKKFLCEYEMQNALYLTLCWDGFEEKAWNEILLNTEQWLALYNPDELKMHALIIDKQKPV